MPKAFLATWLFLSLSQFLKDVRCNNPLDLPFQVQGNAGTGKSAIHAFKEAAVGLSINNGISKESRAAPQQNHDVIFVVRPRHEEELKQFLEEISDPSQPNYGKYMTRQEVADFTSNAEAHRAVMTYLEKAGAMVISESPYGEHITARAPIAFWEGMFDTEFFTYAHVQNSGKKIELRRFVRAEKYSVPADLDEHVESVFNTIQVPLIKKKVPMTRNTRSKNDLLANGMGPITPAVLNKVYQIGSNVGSPRSVQAVFEAVQQSFSPQDLSTFQSRFSLPPLAVNTSIGNYSATSNYCKVNGNSCSEGNLDIQYLMAISQSPTIYYYSDDYFSVFLMGVSNLKLLPLVVSISYGIDEYWIPPSELNAFNFQAIKLGSMGVTITVSSGDDGANSDIARDNMGYCGYSPSFPASSPYVLSVGATMGVESGTPEIVCQSNLYGVITSGGGFSNYYPRPTYQTAATTTYLSSVAKTNKAPQNGYNPYRRGYPDIALAGANYQVVIGGRMSSLFGTSASAPLAAAMISLLNAARLKARMPPIGFINPVLYTYSSMFTNDVTSGHNKCVAGYPSPVCCAQGFYAAPGWDPVTGLGSLNFTRFKAFMMSPMTPVPTAKPSDAPTALPTSNSSPASSVAPSQTPSIPLPSTTPTFSPTIKPSVSPSMAPSLSPTTSKPSATPTSLSPSRQPVRPSTAPSLSPTTSKPSATPTSLSPSRPSVSPSMASSLSPTTSKPSATPTSLSPSGPSVSLSMASSLSPTTSKPSVSLKTPPTRKHEPAPPVPISRWRMPSPPSTVLTPVSTSESIHAPIISISRTALPTLPPSSTVIPSLA